MPIPELDEYGFLPPGAHICSLDELKSHFGGFQSSDRRPRLFVQLLMLISELRRKPLCVAIIIDGSFTTSKAAPNDIDLILVLRQDHDWMRDPGPDEYNLLSRHRLRQRFGFDAFVASEGSAAYYRAVEFFGRMRDTPEGRKGMLRINL